MSTASLPGVPRRWTTSGIHETLGKRYDRSDFFKGTGVSMHLSKARSLRVALTYRAGSAIATLELQPQGIVWARTGGPDHITVWAAPETLLDCVVECESCE